MVRNSRGWSGRGKGPANPGAVPFLETLADVARWAGGLGDDGRDKVPLPDLPDTILDDPSLDAVLGANRRDLGRLAGGNVATFHSVLSARASRRLSDPRPDGTRVEERAFALSFVGPASAVLALAGNRDGVLRLLAYGGALAPTAGVRLASGMLDAMGLAALTPGRARALLASVADRDASMPDGVPTLDPASLASGPPDRIVGVAFVGVRSLAVGPDGPSDALGPDPDVAEEAREAWRDAMHVLCGYDVDVSPPAGVTEALVEMTLAVADRTVARQRGLHGIRTTDRAARAYALVGEGSASYLATFGGRRGLGPVTVPDRAEELAPVHVVEALAPLLRDAKPVVVRDPAEFARLAEGLDVRGAVPTPVPDRAPPRPPQPPAAPTPPRLQPQARDNVVGLFDRKPR